MTGAISSVDVDDLVKRTTTNPAEALQGKIAGVNIMKAGGNAGAGVQVKIRGVKTFGDNQPLYIIDGFPVILKCESARYSVNGSTERWCSRCHLWFGCCKWCHYRNYQNGKRVT